MPQTQITVERLLESDPETTNGKEHLYKISYRGNDYCYWGRNPLLDKTHEKDTVTAEIADKTSVFQGRIQYKIIKVIEVTKPNADPRKNPSLTKESVDAKQQSPNNSLQSTALSKLPEPMTEEHIEALMLLAKKKVAKLYSVTEEDIMLGDPVVAEILYGLIQIERQKFEVQKIKREESFAREMGDRIEANDKKKMEAYGKK